MFCNLRWNPSLLEYPHDDKTNWKKGRNLKKQQKSYFKPNERFVCRGKIKKTRENFVKYWGKLRIKINEENLSKFNDKEFTADDVYVRL